MPTTTDPRYVERLEAQLSQADQRSRTDADTISRQSDQIGKLQAEVADLRPLAEAAAEHRKSFSSEKKRADEAEKALKIAQSRIVGLEEMLAEAEGKIASQQDDLAAYEALDEKVKSAESVFDLLD